MSPSPQQLSDERQDPRSSPATRTEQHEIESQNDGNESSSVINTSATADSDKEFVATNWKGLTLGSVSKVTTNLWPLLLVSCACDVMVFILHRISHRFTNELSVRFLGGGLLSPEAIGNMWWLTADPAISNFQTGYQTLTIIVFLLAFPLNVLLKTFASCATIFICEKDVGKEQKERTPWWRPVLGLRRAFPIVLKEIWPQVTQVWQRVFVVELLVSAAVIPLQFASLAVITLPLTLPLLLSLHAAGPAAVLENLSGFNAIKRSRELVSPMKWQLAVPFIGLVVGQRGVEAIKTQLLASMPPRFYRELVELPAALLIGGFMLSLFLGRCQDVLPFVAFSAAKKGKERVGLGGREG